MSEVDKREEGYASQREELSPQPKKHGFKRHCARFWWIYLAVFVVVVLLVVLLIIFVAVPKIAQQKINEAKLTIQGIHVTNTKSENFTMSINSTITTDGSQHATIDPFEGVMYLEDWEPQTPFATVQFPQTTAAKLSVVNVTQFTPITDMNAFTVFNTWLLVNETLRVTVKGDTKLKVKGLSRKYSVTFKKTISMPGLNNFNGLSVPESTVSLTADEQGDNFKGITTIPNPSLVSFDVGNASFHTYLLGEEFGTTYIDNMMLLPGDNNFTMRANLTSAYAVSTISQAPYCSTWNLPIVLRGMTVVNDGQPLSYYADALASSNQTTEVPFGYDLKNDVNVTISCS